MKFTMYNLAALDIRFKVSDSSNTQGSLLDDSNNQLGVTPNSTIYVDKGVVCGCMSGTKSDVVLYPYLANGAVNKNMTDLKNYISNNNDQNYANVIFTQYAEGNITADMFGTNCKLIKQLCLGGSNIQTIADNAFSNVKVLSLLNNNVSTMTVGNNAFQNSGISGTLALYNVSSIGSYAFANNQVTNVSLSSQLTTIGAYAFASCTQLQTVQIPAKVTSIPEGVFSGNTSLTTVDFTSLWDGQSQLASIGDRVFDSCYGLNTIKCPWTTPPTLDPAAFGNLVSMNGYGNSGSYSAGSSTYIPFTIYVPQSAVNAYKQAAGWSNVASAIQGVSNANSV